MWKSRKVVFFQSFCCRLQKLTPAGFCYLAEAMGCNNCQWKRLVQPPRYLIGSIWCIRCHKRVSLLWPLVKWLAKSVPNWEVLGSIPAASKVFCGQLSILKFILCKYYRGKIFAMIQWRQASITTSSGKNSSKEASLLSSVARLEPRSADCKAIVTSNVPIQHPSSLNKFKLEK